MLDPKKYKIITGITILLALLGLIINIWPLIIQDSGKNVSETFWIFSFFVRSINLSLPGIDSFDYEIRNYLNIGFYSLFLIGGILFLTSNQRESRLIRFCFSLILLYNSLGFIFSLINPLINEYSIFKSWIYLFLALIRDGLCIVLSYWLLTVINKSKAIDIIKIENLVEYQEATKWQRFFHLNIDLIFCVLVFSPYVMYFIRGPLQINALQSLAILIGPQAVIYLLVIIIRFIFYVFFESVFSATPAKFLSETRVITLDGARPKTGTIFLRTLIRFVPFEAFSVLVYGWHDTWTKTMVVKEKRTGVKGGTYFLIPLFFLIIGFGAWFGYEKYKSYLYNLEQKKEYSERINEIETRLKNLCNHDVIKLNQIDGYSSDNIYLKVEKVNGDSIYCSVLKIEFYNPTPIRIEKFYDNNNAGFPGIEISKAMLANSVTKDYNGYHNNERKGTDMLKSGINYEIEEIIRLYEPALKDEGHSSETDSTIRISFTNNGWEAQIIKVITLEGKTKWTTEMPEINSEYYLHMIPPLTIFGKNFDRDEAYKFKFIIEDSTHKKQTYMVEGMDTKRTLKRVE